MSKRPANVTFSRRYRGRVASSRKRKPPRKGQSGSGFFDTCKKIANTPLVKQLGKKALNFSSKPYKYRGSKVKNKTAKIISNQQVHNSH